MIIDANNSFTVDDFSIKQKHKLPLPSDTFLEYLTNPDSVKKKTYEFGEINSNLKQKEGSLRTKKIIEKKG